MLADVARESESLRRTGYPLTYHQEMLSVEAEHSRIVGDLSCDVLYDRDAESVLPALFLVVVMHVLLECPFQSFHISELFVAPLRHMHLLVHEVPKESLLVHEQVFEVPVEAELSVHHRLQMSSEPASVFLV